MEYQMTSEPTQMFIDALCAALRAGRAYLTCDDGTTDEDPEIWGWRHQVLRRPLVRGLKGRLLQG
jgi:hypothetical protein